MTTIPPLPILRYVFDSEACVSANRFLDDASDSAVAPPLVRNPDTTACAPSLGVAASESSSAAASATSLAKSFAVRSEGPFVENALQRGGGGDGITFEIWLKVSTSAGGGDGGSSSKSAGNRYSQRLRRPIASIGLSQPPSSLAGGGEPASGSSFNPCDEGGAGVDLMLSMRGDRDLEVHYRTSDTYFEPCQVYPLRDVLLPWQPVASGDGGQRGGQQKQQEQIVHVAISLADSHQQVFVNGVGRPVLDRPFSSSLRHWNSKAELHLLSYPVADNDIGSTWLPLTEGITAYQFAAYEGTLNSTQVLGLIGRGLPPSPPYALNSTVTINEDAERVAGSHYGSGSVGDDAELDWYLSRPRLPSDDVESIRLPIGSVDDDIRSFQESLLSETADDFELATNLTRPQRFVYVVEIPAVGCLYRPDGMPVADAAVGCVDGNAALANVGRIRTNNEEASALYLVTDDPPALVYVPPLNEHSPMSPSPASFARFTYCVSEVPVFDRRRCPSTGSVEIVILPVNDPPIATRPPVEALVVCEGGTIAPPLPKLLLTGTDVDKGDTIQRVQITDPPKRGYLALSVSSFRTDGLRHGTPLSDLNYTVPTSFSDPVYVTYVWDTAAAAASRSQQVIVKDRSATDSFRFRVADRFGTWSSEEEARVVILSSLTASAEERVVVKEDSSMGMTMKWHGNDTSKYRRDIGYFVEAAPPAETGVFVYGSSRKRVIPGNVLSYAEAFPYSKGLDLTFIPSPNYCTGLPSSANNNTTGLVLRFRTVAFAPNTGPEESAVSSVSDTREQKLFVHCVIDALELVGPTELDFSISALTLAGAARDPCLASELHYLNSTTGADPFSSCKSVARINGIQVSTKDTDSSVSAQVTIFTEAGYLTFNPAYWNSTTPLHGRRALNKGSVSFSASPSDLTNVLSDLVYQSFLPGNGTIGIVIKYGDCSAFDSVGSRDSVSLKSTECQVLRHDILVAVVPDDTIEEMPSQLVSGFPWQVVFCMLGYPAIYYAFVRLAAYAKGAAAAAADGDDCTVEDRAVETPAWIEYLSDDTGDYYYENTDTGEVTWLAPVGEPFVPWEEVADDESGEEEFKAEERIL